jgi:Flp pilus assembly protein TadG
VPTTLKAEENSQAENQKENQMKMRARLFARIKDQSGATVILVAIVLPILLGFTALAVDVGYVMTTRNELQSVADAQRYDPQV